MEIKDNRNRTAQKRVYIKVCAYITYQDSKGSFNKYSLQLFQNLNCETLACNLVYCCLLSMLSNSLPGSRQTNYPSSYPSKDRASVCESMVWTCKAENDDLQRIIQACCVDLQAEMLIC